MGRFHCVELVVDLNQYIKDSLTTWDDFIVLIW